MTRHNQAQREYIETLTEQQIREDERNRIREWAKNAPDETSALDYIEAVNTATHPFDDGYDYAIQNFKRRLLTFLDSNK